MQISGCGIRRADIVSLNCNHRNPERIDVVTKSIGMNQSTLSSLGITDISLAEHLKEMNKSHLPQVPLLSGTLDALTRNDVIEEAFLRGSFSNGRADHLSDIDLFVVVEPEKISEAHTCFTRQLQSYGETIIGCHDKFVKDYGGIGFMYLCENHDSKNLHQFDIYFALKGVTPRAKLVDAPRVFAKNVGYSWLDDAGNAVDAMPEPALSFVQEHMGQSDDTGVVSCYNDLVVGLFIMDKHLKRNQTARAFNDNFHNTNAMIEMLRYGVDKVDYNVSLYAFDGLAQDVARSDDKTAQDMVLRIRESMQKNATSSKIRQMFELGTDMLKTYAPEYYDENSKKLEILDRRVFKSHYSF